MHIRIAAPGDLAAIDAIYNQGIAAGMTADLRPLDPERRRQWLEEHAPGAHPVFVAEQEGNIIGWLSLSPYRKGREALRFVAEISYYLDNKWQGKGFGSQLMAFGIKAAKERGYRHLVAILLEYNTASTALLRKYGFEQWGLLPGIADFSGKRTGHLYYGLHIED